VILASEVGDFERAFELLGSEAWERAPLLDHWWQAGRLDRRMLAVLLPQAWQGPRWPLQVLDARTWLDLFKAAGFVSWDSLVGTEIAAPSVPLTVYRGATDGVGAQGMAWTEDLETARRFAQAAESGEERGVIYRAVVPPEAVLAIFRDRAEHEVLVNPDMLRGRVAIIGRADPAVAKVERERLAAVFHVDLD
jgi:hypothetical protein